MSQNIVIVQPPQPARPTPNPDGRIRSCPPPIFEWALIGVLVILVFVVVAVAAQRKSGGCEDTSCAASGDSLEQYMARCTQDYSFTPTYCAEMWERVKGTRPPATSP